MPFLQTQFQEALPTLSPDGKYVAYQSNKSGTYEIYVKPFPAGKGEWTISDNGGRHPLWSRQGDEIFYIEKNTMMAVPMTIQQTFSREHPQKLFSGEQVGSLFMDDGDFRPHYDVSADGQRFVGGQDGKARPPRGLSFRTGSESSRKGINIMVLPSTNVFPKMFFRLLHTTSYLPPATCTDAQHQFLKE